MSSSNTITMTSATRPLRFFLPLVCSSKMARSSGPSSGSVKKPVSSAEGMPAPSVSSSWMLAWLSATICWSIGENSS